MTSHFFLFCYLSFPVLILSIVPKSSGSDYDQFTSCSQPFQCSNIPNLGYPFWGGSRPVSCGHPNFELNCQYQAPQITINTIPYRVLYIDNPKQILTVARAEFWNNPYPCPTHLHTNATLDTAHFAYSDDSQNMTIYYGCPALPGVTFPNQFSCTTNGTTTASYYYIGISSDGEASNLGNEISRCSSNVVFHVSQKVAQGLASMNIKELLDSGFGLRWEANETICRECVQSGGVCGSGPGNEFSCLCSDQAYSVSCNTTRSGSGITRSGSGASSSKPAQPTPKNIVLFIAGAVIAGVGLGWGIFACKQRRRKRLSARQSTLSSGTKSKEISPSPMSRGLTTVPSTYFTKSIPSYPSSKFSSDIENASTYFGAQVFDYTELEEATGNFDRSRELGDGGFGAVYYGQLQDGRVVAVKRLYENNFKRVEQFMNEVEILTRLRHVNLVKLYGCTSKRSRELLLVYEYISNGTVADHLHGRRANSGLLSWPVRLSVAVETAGALAYLHESDIIHRDVKTNNILLDNDFRVKVADFGLSRLFPTDCTHVSTAPQGTPGYVDPEYYQCYQLTEKSDVYSFGVVLIELISSKQAVDTNRDRHDINLSNMAVNKIQNHALHELVDPSLGFEANNSVRGMITLVAELAFRCLQTEKDMRPSMGEVLEALKGIKDGSNAQKAEEVDIAIEDEVGLLKAGLPPMSPYSEKKWGRTNSSTPNSSG